MVRVRETIRYLLFLFSWLMIDPAYGQLMLPPEQLLSEYVQRNSVTGNEAPAANYLLEKCRQAGLYTRVFSNEINAFNFAASLYPLESRKPNIVFHTHCDVVPEGDTRKWTYPPFSGTIADSAVWGRGAIDNKAMGIMELVALAKFVERAKNEEFPCNVTMLVVSNEEEGGRLGVGKVMNEYLDLLNPVVVYGEGGAGLKNILQTHPDQTVFGISVIHKQGIWLDLSLKNEASAHGAIVSDENINDQLVTALHRFSKSRRRLKITPASQLMVRELSNHEKGIIKWAYRHPKLFFPLVKRRILNDPVLSLIFTDTYNLTRISSPYSSVNTVASEVHAILDCRFLEPVESADLVKQITRKCHNRDLNIRIVRESPSAFYTKPDLFFKWMKEAIECNSPDAVVVPVLFPAIADNNYFRNKNIPTYGIIPCLLSFDDIKTIHNTDEHISIACLEQGIDIYSNLIRRALSSDEVLELRDEH